MAKVYYTEEMAKTIVDIGNTAGLSTTPVPSSNSKSKAASTKKMSPASISPERPAKEEDEDDGFQIVVSKTKTKLAHNAECRERKQREAVQRAKEERAYRARRRQEQREEDALKMSRRTLCHPWIWPMVVKQDER
jgi:hypothetical protein